MSRPEPALRQVHSAEAACRRAQDSKVFRVEQEILAVVQQRQRDTFDAAARLVVERLAPLDPKAAAVVPDELRKGVLP